MIYKFGLINIMAPTPIEIKRAANSLLFICSTIGGISYIQNFPNFALSISVLGAISKGISLFFSYDKNDDKDEKKEESDNR